jgi:flavin-dependent dehydrogenase
MRIDIAIIGGGPGGSTCAGLLKKYAPELEVSVFEREQFPREHVGESALPPISKILNELGCWDEVESAGFPIKIGATYRWGNSEKLWDFEFMPINDYREEARPRQWSEQTRQLAMQVDRERYDDILLRHAASLGANVFQSTQVRSIEHEDDRVKKLVLADGTEVEAKWYVDASGASASLRRALGIGVEVPTKLQNIAFYDYWENTEWVTRFPGGATRVLVLSIGAGWIWFIPLSPTRTSIGFVCPKDFYKESGRKPEEMYLWALQQEPMIRDLTTKASREGNVRATRDWSFVADRVVGKNWLLVGEAAGFADPILAAGLTLTQTSAREAAFSLIALIRGEHEADWLLQHYNLNQRTRIQQHIRFADFWYSTNGIFTDLQEYTREIAADAGLDLDPQKAFQWLGTGGFTHDILGQVGIGALDLAGTRQIAQRFVGGKADWQLSHCNQLRLDLNGADEIVVPAYENGQVREVRTLRRGERSLPLCGLFAIVCSALQKGPDLVADLLPVFQQHAMHQKQMAPQLLLHHLLQALEVMLNEGWVLGEHNPERPGINLETPDEGLIVHTNQELNH